MLPPLDAWDQPVGFWLRAAERASTGHSDPFAPRAGRHRPPPEGEAPLRSRRRSYARALAREPTAAALPPSRQANLAAARCGEPCPPDFRGAGCCEEV